MRLNDTLSHQLISAIARRLNSETRRVFEADLACAQSRYDAGADEFSIRRCIEGAAFHATYRPKSAEELAREQAFNAAAHTADMMGGGMPASSRSFREDPNY
jgi:hypothetical protein